MLTRQSDFVSAPLQKELAVLKKKMVEYEQVVESVRACLITIFS
jgi:hypothetical protein